MNKKKVFTIFTLLLVVMFASSSFALAESSQQKKEGPTNPAKWNYISSVSVALNITSAGKAEMDATMVAYSSVNKCKIVSKLQRYTGGQWKDVKEWTYTSNKRTAYWSDYWYVTSGYTYRLLCNFYAYNGSTLLESTQLSRTDTY